jgi:hypothetical protein
MSTFSSPTINDFLAQIHMQTDRVLRDFAKQKREIGAKCSKAGMISSSNHILLLLDAVDEQVEKGVGLLLGELRRALQYPELDPLQLRDLTGPRLHELATAVITMSEVERTARSFGNGQFLEMVAARTKRIIDNVRFWLRQFEIGWSDPIEPETLKRPPQ